MRRTRPPWAAAVLEKGVTHRLTRTLPMARCIIGCQGAAGAGRARDLMQQNSHGTRWLWVSPLASWDLRCHRDCSWACALRKRTKQNPVRAFPDSTHPSPRAEGDTGLPAFCSGGVWRCPRGTVPQPGSSR